MKLADVIEKAINEHLWDGVGEEYDWPRIRCFSCSAVREAGKTDDDIALWGRAVMKLQELFPGITETNCFEDLNGAKRRQLARALWLTWAAMIAREEGVEI